MDFISNVFGSIISNVLARRTTWRHDSHSIGFSVNAINQGTVLWPKRDIVHSQAHIKADKPQTRSAQGEEYMNKGVIVGIIFDVLSGLIKVISPELRALIEQFVKDLDAKAKANGGGMDEVFAKVIASIFDVQP